MTVTVVMEPDWQEKLDPYIDRFFDDRLGPDIVRDARAFCPIDTGRLRESIDHIVIDHVLRVEAGAYYAYWVEVGHENWAWGHFVADNPWVPGQPYLQPALYTTRSY